jgi:hypothetical protein
VEIVEQKWVNLGRKFVKTSVRPLRRIDITSLGSKFNEITRFPHHLCRNHKLGKEIQRHVKKKLYSLQLMEWCFGS